MPALTQPAIGSTSWGTQMNTNLQVLQNQLTNAMQGRMVVNSSTQILLKQYTGDTVEINGLNVSMGSGGIAMNVSDHLVDSSGADTGSGMAAYGGGTSGAPGIYYVYLSNANATYAASSLRASTTKYTTLNGVRYLGATGNAANWRFIGFVSTDSMSTYQDTATQRFVINYYNRRRLSLVSPTEATASWLYNGGWRQANSNTSSNYFEFISTFEDCIEIHVRGAIQDASGTSGNVGVGINSQSANSASTTGAGVGTASYCGEITAMYCGVPTEGYVKASWLERTNSGVNQPSFIGNQFSSGAWAQQSGMIGTCMG